MTLGSLKLIWPLLAIQTDGLVSWSEYGFVGLIGIQLYGSYSKTALAFIGH